MATILITNDDGITAPSLVPLKRALGALGEVMVLAPERNWSAAGHAKTMHKPLRLHAATLADGSRGHSTNGGPSDCVALAALGATGQVPDVVVSGINLGYNLGSDITYSGTVAAAMEAVLNGIPAVAVSACGAAEARTDLEQVWERAAEAAARLVRELLARGLPPYTLLNLNVPCVAVSELRGLRITRLGQRAYTPQLVVREDPRGIPYFWFGGRPSDGAPVAESDIDAIRSGYISLTPLKLDLTHHEFLDPLQSWNLGG